ncbi:MAG TPA: dipeptidase PepE [Candidatus Dormibacteraeota bacterium]
MPRRLMLHAGGDVTSARPAMLEHLRGARTAVMIPYAQSDHDRATARFGDWLAPHGVEITGVHTAGDPAAAIANAEAIFVTGGNSFRLVAALHRLSLLGPVRSAIDRGIPYFGASAGANAACPTIRTTNDMPIVQPPSFVAFDLVPFQINPHYIDPPPPEARIGETREERLNEFLEENDATVVALREQSWLAVDGPSMDLRGTGGAVLFRRGAEPRQLKGGTDLSRLLLETPRYDV